MIQYLNGPCTLNEIFIDSFLVKQDTIINEENKVKDDIKALIYSELRRVVCQKTKGVNLEKYKNNECVNSLAYEVWSIVRSHYNVKSDNIPTLVLEEIKRNFNKFTPVTSKGMKSNLILVTIK